MIVLCIVNRNKCTLKHELRTQNLHVNTVGRFVSYWGIFDNHKASIYPQNSSSQLLRLGISLSDCECGLWLCCGCGCAMSMTNMVTT